MNLRERLIAARDVPDDADLAEVLGVEPGAIGLCDGVLTVGDETISFAEVREALAQIREPGRTVKVEDL